MTIGRDELASWVEEAECQQGDSEVLFADGAAQSLAITVCSRCPVRTECLAHALDHRISHGVWGGMTERERRALLRRRPGVTSWRHVLEAARFQYQHPVASSSADGPSRTDR
ncbi:WhiB family transcriptional regulator [Streptomyces sp. NPDC017943]|uniref:WhiB family transcriptional regulator n=1 Tax=Streptomyces TaxID=1883 RepID=UPI003453A700